MIKINNKEEMQKYYIKEINMYSFNDDVDFKCNIVVDSGIFANDIKALNIKAHDINSCDINALDINANKISFNAVCFAYEYFKCNSIKGTRKNSRYFCLDSDVIIKSKNI